MKMKIQFNIIKNVAFMVAAAFILNSCQKMEEPALGNYPVDANPVGGPLKFYVPFDFDTTDPLKFAVDNIRARFPSDNPLTATAGIAGKAVQGGVAKKFIAYPSANDFAATASDLTVAFWSKHGVPTQTEFAFALTSDNWAKAAMFCLVEGTANNAIIKLFVDEQSDPARDHWFEWVGVPGTEIIFDNQWHHLAFVYNKTTSVMTFYIDGVAKGTNAWANPNHGAIKFNTSKINGFRIGGSGNPDEGWMNSWSGSIDNFRLYNTALSTAEVLDLFTNKK